MNGLRSEREAMRNVQEYYCCSRSLF